MEGLKWKFILRPQPPYLTPTYAPGVFGYVEGAGRGEGGGVDCCAIVYVENSKEIYALRIFRRKDK